MYLIDKPLYAIQFADGSLAEDQWSKDFPIWVTFSKQYADEQLKHHKDAKVVIYCSDYTPEKQEASEQLARYILDSDTERDDYKEHCLQYDHTDHPYYWAAVILDCQDGEIFIPIDN